MKPAELKRALRGLTHQLTARTGEKCEHDAGFWVVMHEEKFYTMSPCTQIQKDVWLSAAKSKAEQEERLKMLRWCWAYESSADIVEALARQAALTEVKP